MILLWISLTLRSMITSYENEILKSPVEFYQVPFYFKKIEQIINPSKTYILLHLRNMPLFLENWLIYPLDITDYASWNANRQHDIEILEFKEDWL